MLPPIALSKQLGNHSLYFMQIFARLPPSAAVSQHLRRVGRLASSFDTEKTFIGRVECATVNGRTTIASIRKYKVFSFQSYPLSIGLVLAGLLLPKLGLAQVFKHFEVGTYVLANQPKVQQPGGLYLQAGDRLLVRNLAGATTVYAPNQVSSFRVGSQKFVSTGGFQTRSGLGDKYVRQAFAEQLDSGQVVLLRYQALAGNNPTPLSGDVAYGGDAALTVYLLHPAGATAVTPVQANWSKGNKRLEAALRPYLAQRPDLNQMLTDKRITPDNLPALIQALNTGQPYTARPR